MKNQYKVSQWNIWNASHEQIQFHSLVLDSNFSTLMPTLCYWPSFIQPHSERTIHRLYSSWGKQLCWRSCLMSSVALVGIPIPKSGSCHFSVRLEWPRHLADEHTFWKDAVLLDHFICLICHVLNVRGRQIWCLSYTLAWDFWMKYCFNVNIWVILKDELCITMSATHIK